MALKRKANPVTDEMMLRRSIMAPINRKKVRERDTMSVISCKAGRMPTVFNFFEKPWEVSA